MRIKSILAALLLIVAGLQTAQAQGIRIYTSDGTILQFSLRTDSIVFYDGIGSDQDLGVYTPVNQRIVGTWYLTKYETVTFNEDGTTDYMEGATYEFMPFQGTIIIYNASGAPVDILKVYKVSDEGMIIGSPDGSNLSVWSSAQPVQLVTSIVLSETSLLLQPNDMRNLTATVLPEDADNPAVTWESSNVEVAEVNKNGRIVTNAVGTCVITCSATDGSGVKAECQVTVKIDKIEYVDLGLPSGTLWATCNLGASSPEDYGDYFAWGETTTKTEFSWSTYKYCKGSKNTMTKYCVTSEYGYNGFIDNLDELLPEDDAATANWGSEWQMPSSDQCAELGDTKYTNADWTTLNGVSGVKITSKKNGKSIFLPAANNFFGSQECYYWSRTLTWNSNDCGAMCMVHNYEYRNWGDISDYRYSGLCVRPVRVLEKKVHEYVDLALPSGTLWAKCNVGADSPEEYGDYFAWGETTTKNEYNWDTYKYGKNGGMSVTKYCTNSKFGTVDNKTELEPGDDAATANWGSEWQMPSLEQLKELINSSNTTIEATTLNGVKVYKIKSNLNGKLIFLPAAGYRNDDILCYENEFSYYWSRSIDTDWPMSAGMILCTFGSFNWGYEGRCPGYSVRPVRKQ